MSLRSEDLTAQQTDVADTTMQGRGKCYKAGGAKWHEIWNANPQRGPGTKVLIRGPGTKSSRSRSFNEVV